MPRRYFMDKVLKYLKSNQQTFLKELVEYVSIPSVSAQEQHKPDMRRAAEWIAEKSRRAGLKPEIFQTKGHPLVLARNFSRRTKDRPHFLIYGHYDVQPAEPFDLWKSPPFQPRVQGKLLYGRGASDNK